MRIGPYPFRTTEINDLWRLLRVYTSHFISLRKCYDLVRRLNISDGLIDRHCAEFTGSQQERHECDDRDGDDDSTGIGNILDRESFIVE